MDSNVSKHAVGRSLSFWAALSSALKAHWNARLKARLSAAYRARFHIMMFIIKIAAAMSKNELALSRVHRGPGVWLCVVCEITSGLWPDTFFHHLYEVSNQPWMLLWKTRCWNVAAQCRKIAYFISVTKKSIYTPNPIISDNKYWCYNTS